jgi:hypothetical protein
VTYHVREYVTVIKQQQERIADLERALAAATATTTSSSASSLSTTANLSSSSSSMVTHSVDSVQLDELKQRISRLEADKSQTQKVCSAFSTFFF